jgi:hypothetical protein
MRDLSSPDQSGGHVSDSVSAPKLFISYRRDETPVSAAWLYEVLVERFGEPNVFMDLKLKPGENFVKRISEVVGSCHILLLVMGPRWADPEDGEGAASIKDPDDFVRLEAEIAMARDDVQVLPVLVGGAKMPHPDELPEQLRELTQIHAKQLTNERRAEDMKELVGRVDELLPPETFVHVPDPSPPPPKETLEPSRDGRSRRWLAPVLLAAALLVAVLLVATGGLDGDGESGESRSLGQSSNADERFDVDEEITELDARGNWVVVTTGEEEAEQLERLDMTDGTLDELTSQPAHFNGMDVGTDEGGRPAVVATVCKSHDACDVNRLKGDSLVPEGLAPSPCTAVRPSMAQGTILFSRGACEGHGLYVRRPNRKETKLTSEATSGADVDGLAAAAISKPRTLERYDLSGDRPASTPVELEEGHQPMGPVVVDGKYVYFLDLVGSSYWIARIDRAAAEPVLKHYRGGEARLKPAFGVTGGVLWVSGLPRGGSTNDKRVIIRDDDPAFKPVDDAVK